MAQHPEERTAVIEKQADALWNRLGNCQAERDCLAEALRLIRRHHAIPAGESWEEAYNEVCTLAIEALEAYSGDST